MTTRREFLQSIPVAGAALGVGGNFAVEGTSYAAPQVSPEGHFHPKGKPPSTYTLEVLRKARAELPFQDRRDFDERNKGFIAPMKDLKIKADAGHDAWDMERYQFFNEQEDFDSIHPSLTRISQLNMNYGLYKVTDDIFQVRGLDISDLTLVRGRTGWIIFDVMLSRETARAAWKLFQEHVGEGLPVTAVVYSHSHVDHWGGIRGIVDEADVRAGKIEIIAPRNFMHHTISENVYAGNAMNRRLFYQYGILLPASPYGHAGQGLGMNAANGEIELIPPTRSIDEPIEYITVDGVPMVFQNAPNTEAPTEMHTYLPEMKALWMAENVNALLHNIYTLRGAPVRDALRWSSYLNEALYMFGQEAEVLFHSHHWPRWGNERVQQVLRDQRDLYANMNNQSLHYANQGVTINQIHNVYELPKSLQQSWHTRGYHGSPEHNSRGVVQRFLGFWDCNPTTLIPLSPSDSAPLYVEMMGGAQRIISKGRELHDDGRYFEASEILNKLVLAEPDNEEAKDLLADVFEQIGYQQENPGLRNSFLAGAFELRSGIPEGVAQDSAGPDVIRAMSTGLFLNFLGIKMDTRKAEGMQFTINLITPDNGEKFVVELSNATLTNIEGYLADNPDLTLTINREDLEQTMMGAKTLEAQITDGTATVEGDVSILKKLASTMVDFDPRFEVLPGTKARGDQLVNTNPYEVQPGAPCAE